MSMIPFELSAMRPASGSRMGTVGRLPRAIGWMSAAALSAGLWSLMVTAIRLVF